LIQLSPVNNLLIATGRALPLEYPDTWLVGAVEMSANLALGPSYATENTGLDVVSYEIGCNNGTGQLDYLQNVD
jgi:hypothetical protein